jgi:hypothetical protein
MTPRPSADDLVVRRDRREDRPVLVLHRASGPDQVLVQSRDEAVTAGMRHAKRMGVRLWFSDGVDDFTLIEDFREKSEAADRRLVQRLRAEFLEMPGLRLTIIQARRLCGIDAGLCEAVLDALVDVKFLRRNRDGTYSRLSDGRSAV